MTSAPTPSSDPLALLAEIEAIARLAGAAVMSVYGTDFDVRHKPDASPVTLADERAEAVIVPALHARWPEVPVVAEEAAARGEAPAVGDRFWLVDPLDGTREFVARNGEFTVNIALVEHGAPVLGVVFAPALGKQFSGVVGQGAWMEDGSARRAIACRPVPAAGAVLASSRSHGDEAATWNWLGALKVAGRIVAGSSLKFGLIASAQADLYVRHGRTMEWDTAAGHAVVLAAGGSVCDLKGSPLRYGKPGHENPFFVVRGQPAA